MSRGKNLDQSQSIRLKLASMSPDGITEFVINLVRKYPEIGLRIEEELDLRHGRVDGIVESTRKEIEELASEYLGSHYWSDDDDVPDYSNVKKKLQMLLDSGHADEVLELGKDLWRLGNEQVEFSDEEYEIASQISECMDVVQEAVRQSSLSVRDRILWTIRTIQEDYFFMLDLPHDRLNEIEDVNSWSEVADYLMGELKTDNDSTKEELIEKVRRATVMNWAIKALEKSGRQKDIVPLLEREAPISNCYTDLLERLLLEGRRDEAKEVALKGYRETVEHHSWIASKLQAILCEMAEQDGDLPLAAAYYSMEFFKDPSLESYVKLKSALESSNYWPDTRKAVFKFLETGFRPDLDSAKHSVNSVKIPRDHWPLPCPEILLMAKENKHLHFPNDVTLLHIAILEKSYDEIVHRYNLVKKSYFHEKNIDELVADAVNESHPDLALKIYGKLAQDQIAKVKTVAYDNAARFLAKMKTVYEINDRMSEWPALIQSIRTTHKSKRSLMEILKMM